MLARYPFEPAWARRQLEEWTHAGRVVAVSAAQGESVMFSDPANLEQVQRGSLGILRREVVTCSPPQFADFLLRWQGVHPDTRRGGSEGLAEVLARLQGLPLDAELWEQTVLPARVPEYQPRWLDEWIAGGEGLWVCQGAPARTVETGRIAFFAREMLRQLPPPESSGCAGPELRRPIACWIICAAEVHRSSRIWPSISVCLPAWPAALWAC